MVGHQTNPEQEDLYLKKKKCDVRS